MFRKPSVPALLIGLIAAFCASGVAQTEVAHAAKVRSRTIRFPKYSHAQMLKVTAELTRQQKFLRDVASRYEAVATYDFAPLLEYGYVWSALRENHKKLNASFANMTPEQANVFRTTYDQLETDVVMSFLDHQLSILNEALELDEAQMDALQKVLTFDLGRKQLLLADRNLTSGQFMQKVAEVSASTEKRILDVLSPEQRDRFLQQMTAARDRLTA